MSDIWSVDDSGEEAAAGNDSEEWDCSSGSEEENQPRKRRRKGNSGFRQKCVTLPDDNSQEGANGAGSEGDDDGDMLSKYLATARQQLERSPGPRQRSASPLLSQPDAIGAAAAAVAADHPPGSCDRARLAAEKQRALRERLTQAQHAGKDDDEEDEVVELEDEPDQGPAAGGLQGLTGHDVDDVDPALQLLDELQPEPDDAANCTRHSAAEAADAKAEGKLPLVFKTQSGETVTVMVNPSQPLEQALDRVRKYAEQHGWGRVTKFVMEDVLTGRETPEDLDLDADDIIDVWIAA